MKKRVTILLIFVVAAVFFQRCQKDPSLAPVLPTATPYQLTIPNGFPTILNMPSDNPLTVEGIALGKQLFYDPILSGNNTMSCGSCHAQPYSFSDHNKQFSEGITGVFGTRNAPGIINVLWNPYFFGDGRAATLEQQISGPVENHKEMDSNWPEVVSKLQTSKVYPALFQKAFQTTVITQQLVVNAIAQFERTFISSNSRYDKWQRNEIQLDSSEIRGYTIFFTETGDCYHCHVTSLLTDNLFHNNGLDAFPADSGRADVTKNPNDIGKFKTPTLRNIAVTAPYMHDGRFTTLQQVVQFYSTGLKFSATIDPLMRKVNQGGDQLTAQQAADLIAFLNTFTDSTFITNTAIAPPAN